MPVDPTIVLKKAARFVTRGICKLVRCWCCTRLQCLAFCPCLICVMCNVGPKIVTLLKSYVP